MDAAPGVSRPLWERLLDRGLLPDWVVRQGIRRLLRDREFEEASRRRKEECFAEWLRGPVAVHTADANAQHYEVPPEFFELVLGPCRKYSCAYYPVGNETLAQAERAMLGLTCERALLRDGQKVLELGCGWGSLTLWMAERFPGSAIHAVSNSRTQRDYIQAQAAARGLANVRVAVRDMVAFDPVEAFGGAEFDRVVSVEMFEHMRNWSELLRRVGGWLRTDGRLFLHVFCHREYAYPYEVRDASDWMSRYFFTGGIMPSFDMAERMRGGLQMEERWEVNGRHYWRTCEQWLLNLDANRAEVLELFARTYGPGAEARKWFARWRVFFLACAEMFRWRAGERWLVAHYRMRKGL